MIAGNPVRESYRMLNLRGILDREEAIGTAHGEVYEHYLTALGSERCEKVCILLERLAHAYEWPEPDDGTTDINF